MKTLITGGSGFLGSHLADRLLGAGNEVLALDNYETGRRENLAEQEGLTVVEGSIADRPLLDKLFAEFKPDVVAHAAVSYKDPDAWEQDIEVNALGTVNTLRAALANDTGRFIYFQTGLSYGIHPDEQPITLATASPASRATRSRRPPASTTSSSRGSTTSPSGSPTSTARATSPGPAPTFYSRLSKGQPCFVVDSRRDQTYVDDMTDLLEMAVNGTGKGTYHVGSGSDRPVKDMFDLIVDAMGVELDYEVEVRERPEDDAATLLLDPTRTIEDFGWEPKIPMEEGIPKTVAWYEENPPGETYTHLKAEELKVK